MAGVRRRRERAVHLLLSQVVKPALATARSRAGRGGPGGILAWATLDWSAVHQDLWPEIEDLDWAAERVQRALEDLHESLGG